MPIILYNKLKENHSVHPNNFPIYRGKSVLGNPYTHKPLKNTLAIYQVKDRDEALKKYDLYFDEEYKTNIEFTKIVDNIYEKYKNGEVIYLECYCSPLPCHGDIIIKKLEERLLRERLEDIKKFKK